uniref:Uncharacterized protein n=1 Tax=viral metagenome TaxID=1070528 RepID=A0A6M3J1L1_9ZZZZ
MDLSSLTLTELKLMTKDQIVTALTKDRRETKCIVSTGDKRGQLREVRETRDLAGKLVSSQEVTWTYFKNGNVDTITTIDKDAKGTVINKRIVRHNEGGGLAPNQKV